MSVASPIDNVGVTCATKGQADFTIGPAIQGYRSFSDLLPSGGAVTYFAHEITLLKELGAQWEIGTGTFNATTGTITRTTVLASSNPGAKTNFPGPMTYVFNANDMKLSALADVNVTEGAGIDGYALVWNQATSKWVASAVPQNYFTPLVWTSGPDLVLGIGQSALVTASAATSIPLHVACGDGQEYVIDIINSAAIGSGSNVSAYLLQPNNTAYTSGAIRSVNTSNTAGTLSGSATSTSTSYQISATGTLRFSQCIVNTSTAGKYCKATSLVLNSSSGITAQDEYNYWTSDITTPHSSLGTIICPVATSLVINVRRVA